MMKDKYKLVSDEVIEVICNAYESGFGNGYDVRDMVNPYSKECNGYRAWDNGYNEGTNRKKENCND